MELDLYQRREIDQSGRAETISFGTLYGTWLGVGTTILAGGKGDKSFAGGMMFGAPIGFFSSLGLTRNANITDGQSSLISFGGTWGTWQGLGLSILADKDDDRKTLVGSAMAGGILGLIATSGITRRGDISTGDASLISSGGLWGTWFAIMSAIFAEIEDGNSFFTTVLAGGDASVLLMATMAPYIDISRERVRLINIYGVAGTLIGPLLGVFVVETASILGVGSDITSKIFIGSVIVGGLYGLYTGIIWTKDYDAKRKNAFKQDNCNSLLSFDQGKVKWDLPIPTFHISEPMPHGLGHLSLNHRSIEMQAKLISIHF